MARGVLLGTLVNDLRAEVSQSVSAAAGQNYRPTLVRKLQKAQNFLYQDFDWPFLNVRATDISLAYQSNLYDIPSPLKLETLHQVRVYWSGLWSDPLPRGITPDHYNTYNSDNLVTVDPVLRWDVRYTGVREQIEVWPMPQTNGTPLRVTGKQPLATFISDSDVCTLDSDLLILWAAADILLRSKSTDSVSIKAERDALYTKLKGRTTKTSSVHSFAGVEQEDAPVSRVPNVAYVR